VLEGYGPVIDLAHSLCYGALLTIRRISMRLRQSPSA
jgi:hypothetical protein